MGTVSGSLFPIAPLGFLLTVLVALLCITSPIFEEGLGVRLNPKP